MKDAVQDAIIEEFEVFDDWLDKYDYLIGLSDSLPLIDPAHKTEKYIVEGCQSRVWVDAEESDGVIQFHADSDAIIVKGLLSLLVRVMSGRTAEEISMLELYFIDAIGLKENLSPTRGNGLMATVLRMKLYAAAIAAERK